MMENTVDEEVVEKVAKVAVEERKADSDVRTWLGLLRVFTVSNKALKIILDMRALHISKNLG